MPIECDSQDTKRSLGQMAEARVFNEEAVKEPLGGLDPGRMEKLTTNQYVACTAEADARKAKEVMIGRIKSYEKKDKSKYIDIEQFRIEDCVCNGCQCTSTPRNKAEEKG